MSSERTLMSVMRTALALIGFGFTIYQFLIKFAPTKPHASHAALNFGVSLIVLGIGTLVCGLVGQYGALRRLRGRRNNLYALGLLQHGTDFRPSPISVIAVLLLLIGLVAILGIALHAGPLG